MSKEKENKSLSQILAELDEQEDVESMVKDNKINFEHKGVFYRLTKPTLGVKKKVRRLRNKKYYEMLEDSSYVTREELEKKLKKKGIDIAEIDKEMIELQRKEEEVSIKALKNKIKKDREKKVDEVVLIRDKKERLSRKKRDLLDSCIEVELREYVDLNLIVELLQKQDKDKWVKAFNSEEDLMNSEDEQLVFKAINFLQILINHNSYYEE